MESPRSSQAAPSAGYTMQQVMDGAGQSQHHMAPDCNYDAIRIEDVLDTGEDYYVTGRLIERLIHTALRAK